MGRFKGMTLAQLSEEREMCNWRIHLARQEIQVLCASMEYRAEKAQQIIDSRRRERLEALDNYMIGLITETEYKRIVRQANEKLPNNSLYLRKLAELDVIVDSNMKDLNEIRWLMKKHGYDPRHRVSKYNPKERRGRPPLEHEMTPERRIIINRILRLMKEKEISKEQLAEISGFSRSNLSAYLTGNRNYSPKAMSKIAYALDIPLADLLSPVPLPEEERIRIP